ncbi:MAG: protein-L-isoaspartate(D-aspartate) O-methyltransferase [Desulfobulbaceae bacterium]|jgi:protein-L-isoaspartate(D-aspartate) O-methyltransferase|nr:protein-L-isoaspartate(D-aspartate) O-methyltransferase [Desulfobulbaceae bacterium]
MSYESSRMRMVREQLIPRGITDQRVLDAMGSVPRHLFVQDALWNQAHGDVALPIGAGQTISKPYVVARMTQALELKGDESVLEIGTGCGYQTAVIAGLTDRVFTVERIKSLHVNARQTLDKLHILNVICTVDDGTLGWSQYAPYDAIIVTAGGPDIPQPLIDQLAENGRMIIPVGERDNQQLVLLEKREGEIHRESLDDVRFVSLIGDHGWQG